MDLKALKLPPNIARDGKMMTKFLEDVERTVNKIIRGVQK